MYKSGGKRDGVKRVGEKEKGRKGQVKSVGEKGRGEREYFIYRISNNNVKKTALIAASEAIRLSRSWPPLPPPSLFLSFLPAP